MKWILGFLFSLIILLPVLSDKIILRRNDLDGDISSYAVLQKSLSVDHIFPQWNFYSNQGLPVVGDPLNTFFNPIALVPLFFFPVATAIKIVYFLCFFLSIVSMYVLLRFFGITQLISFFIGLTYASSGYVVSRIIAGHFEKILSYPALPLIVLCLFILANKKNIQWTVITSLVLTYVFFSGDIYNVLYSIELLLLVEVYIVCTKSRLWHQIILSLFFFIVFSAAKLFPFVQLSQLLIKDSDPFAGSQTVISMIYYLFLPVKAIFSVLHSTFLIPTAYGWWEKIAFVGPGPLLALIFIRRLKYNRLFFLMIVLLFTLILIAMPAFRLNPYHYAIIGIHSLQLFHVPSRVFALLSIFVLLLYGLFVHTLKKKELGIGLLSINLLFVVLFFQATYFKKNNLPLNPFYNQLLTELKNKDESAFAIAQQISVNQIPQYDSFSQNIGIANADYGVQLKDSPSVTLSQFDFGVKKIYTDIMPKYAILQDGSSLVRNLPGKIILRKKNVYVYAFDTYSPFALFNKQEVKDVAIKTNQISVKIDSASKGTLILTQSSFPGWKAYADQKEIPLAKGRFLSISTIPGNHVYRFIFSSGLFIWGSIISASSLFLTSLFLLKKSSHWKVYQVFQEPQA